ncbi:Z1 domain-containing protein [Paenibacillus sp. GP183]|uniref:Z1 domain-containing protein n=1 Tax=Paenibacillus sp. GP183 TaxID=1882751 RepID=UPI00089A2C2A|nr:Z1 domain-containing protein [Paenibacillus sp. GP183]SED14865.1 Z1 domain-containing protein [Paenibacillus sp. GP183]
MMMQALHGPRTRRFLRSLTAEIGAAEADNILKNAAPLTEAFGPSADRISKQGLLFGQIQSGKTNNIMMSMAMASDRGYRLFIVLTSDNTWLYDQTLRRIKSALPGLLTLGKEQWDASSYDMRIQDALEHTGLVLVATKNHNILANLEEFMEQTIPNGINSIIFDDEADQASLNTLINRDTNDLSGVNQSIVNIRDYFQCHIFIQVTATPQSLFLQCADSTFRPEFTVTFQPGADYVGGDEFYEQPQQLSPMRLFNDDEIEKIQATVSAGAEESLHSVPTGLRKALCAFFVSASSKLLSGEGTAYSCMLHLSHLQEPHRRLETLIHGFITRLTRALLNTGSADRPVVLSYLQEAYDDMRLTKDNSPEFEDVCQEIIDNIVSTHIQVLISERDNKIPSYDSPFNILIGGNRLGRGVTIKGLLVTYYGRNSKNPQVDTLLQHCRMYGYRKKDMDVVRFYISKSLLDVFKSVHQSDQQLWKMAQQTGPSNLQAIVLSRSNNTLLKPTRRNVVYLDSLAFYTPGERTFPLLPISKNMALLDQLLMPLDGRAEPAEVPLSMLVQLINLTESEKQLVGWDDEAIRTCLRNMKQMDEYKNKGFLIVRSNRDISKGTRAMLSPNDYRLFYPDYPTLTLYRYNGKVESGWEDGLPRWVPNLRFPDNRFFMVSAF